MVDIPATSIPDAREASDPWTLSLDPSGLWAATVNLDGEWIPLGYFGAREDAEETIAACFHPSRPLEARPG